MHTYLVVYGIVALGHILLQMTLAQLEHRRQRRQAPAFGTPSVAVVVPAYNEDPVLLHRCLMSLDRQDYPEVEVIVVDDGSHNVEAALPVHDEFSSGTFRVLLRPHNEGKRRSQAAAFAEITSDIVVTVDSDTVLAPDAIRKVVRRFEDDRVGAVTGHVEVINRRQNLLTRLIGYRYWTAFNLERAAQSLFGVVMCASGPFSAYRRRIIDEVAADYVGQRFLGAACTFGDDRHLTNLVLARGHRVVYDEEATAQTMVPSTLRSYLRQQNRWNKSFYREIVWTAKFMHRRGWYMATDLVLQAVLPFALVVALGATAYFAVDDPERAWRYVAIVAAIGLLRSVYGILRTGRLGFLLFVGYGFMHVLLLIPVRLWALATLRKGHWGSRSSAAMDFDTERARRELVRARSAEALAEAEDVWSRKLDSDVWRVEDLELYWQPVRSLHRSGAATHAETLLRLRHEGHVIPAARFLAVAEAAGAMARVDQWVTQRTLELLREHASRRKPLRLEVNVSADSVRDLGYTARLRSALTASEVVPRNLAVAISEATVLADVQAACAFAVRVRSLGCRLVLDDLGRTGTQDVDAAHQLLERLPVDYVKLDPALIRSLPHDGSAQDAVRALTAVAHACGVEIVATHVADDATAKILVRLGVDHAQGFHVGVPASVATPLDDIVRRAADASALLATAGEGERPLAVR